MGGRLDDFEMEEFLKSSNSAMSDYNFLFEHIDQQLQNNTMSMAEEIQKGVPDYLIHTHSTI